MEKQVYLLEEAFEDKKVGNSKLKKKNWMIACLIIFIILSIYIISFIKIGG